MGGSVSNESTRSTCSPAVVRRVALVIATAAAATACRSPKYSVSVNAIGDDSPAAHPTFMVIPGMTGIDENDLQFREYAAYIERALTNRGFRVTDSIDSADAAVALNYGVSDPKTFTYTYATPVWGQTGVSSSNSTGIVQSYGNTSYYSGKTTYTPTYGVVGSQTHTAMSVIFVRYFGVVAYDLRAFRERQQMVPVWKTVVTSAGPTGDLRLAMPALVVAAEPYFATNPGSAVEVSISANDERIARLRAPTSGIDQPGPAPQQ